MSFPKETIWQGLRTKCLDAIPSECRADPAAPVTLTEWQNKGCYTVQSATKKRFEIVVSSADFGSALATEVECLLDAATEHQVTLWKHVHSSDWLSPPWLGVTVYYWSFFLVLAATRLSGRTAWFLTKDATSKFKRLLTVPTDSPGAGCYRLDCGASISATDRTVTLTKTDSRVHDEAWHLWFSDCAARLRGLAVRSKHSAEERLFDLISRSASRLGEDWPSAFRNAINYKSGFAYSAIRRETVLKPLSYLRNPSTYEVAEVLDRFERNLNSVRTTNPITTTPQAVLEMLVDLTFIIHGLTTELHRELIERHGLDRRWRNSRRAFLRTNRLIADKEQGWPF